MLNSPITSLVRSFIHPTVRSTVNKIVHDLGIGKIINNNIHYIGDGLVSSKSNNSKHNPHLHGDKLVCEFTTNLNPNSLNEDTKKAKDEMLPKASIHTTNNQTAFFFDPNTLTRCVCNKMPMHLELDLKLQIKDRTQAYEIYAMLLNKYTFGSMQILMDYIYTYPLPMDVFSLLYMTSNMSGNPDEEFVDYLRTYSDASISLDINRRDQKVMQVVVRDNTCNVFVSMEMGSDKPEAVADNRTPKYYEIALGLKIQLERPDSVFITYPIIVNNQQIPPEAVIHAKEDQYKNRTPVHKNMFIQAGVHNYQDLYSTDILKLPWYDKWVAPKSPLHSFGYKPFMSIAFTLDNLPSPSLFTEVDLFGDLGGFRLDPEVITQIRTQQYAPVFFDGLYNISVFANFKIIGGEDLGWDDGKLTIYNKDPKPVYRIVISEYHGRTGDSGTYTLINNASYGDVTGYLEPGVAGPPLSIKYVQSDNCIVKHVLDANGELHLFVITGTGVYRGTYDVATKTMSYTLLPDPVNQDELLTYTLGTQAFGASSAILMSPDGDPIPTADGSSYVPEVSNGELVSVNTSDVRSYLTDNSIKSKFTINRRGVKYGNLKIARIFTVNVNTDYDR